MFLLFGFNVITKSLAESLPCTRVPWTPNMDSKSARLINQIIVDEESDLNLMVSPKVISKCT